MDLSLDLSILKLIDSGCHALGRRRFFNPEYLVVLLTGPISHTSTQYMDYVEIFNIHWICLLFILLILVGLSFLCV